MKVSEKRLNLVDNIIEEFKKDFFNHEEIIFDLLKEYLQTKTITYLEDLYGYKEDIDD